ncbi:fimbrial biogenesis outer membrane usher protein [Salmonella enterica]|nr:fimbrial biogenesis outer membrane usher protein [Salmonella enterica]
MPVNNHRLRRFIARLAGLLTLLPGDFPPVQAAEVFNPQALEIDNPGQPVADLSAFSSPEGQLPGVYRVVVYVNGERREDAQDITFTAGQNRALVAQITPAMLKAWNVNISAFPALVNWPADKPLKNIGDVIPAASTHFIFSKLRLDVSIPQAAMNATARGDVPPSEWDEGVPAALLGYSISGSNTRRDREGGTDNHHFASLQSGLNMGAWRLRNYATWSQNNDNRNRWNSLNTWLQRDIPSLRSQLILGDSASPAEVFDSIRFRGIQLASDDNMLPDSLRGFAPVIHGIARSSAQVTVKQNGYIIYQTYVAPGAFTISDLYPTAGSGDLQVTIREADGSERTFVQPFSAVPVMQREGQLKYALVAGKLRNNSRGGGNEPRFGQVTAIYGLPHAMTVYGGTLYAPDYRSVVAGLGAGLGAPGSLSVDMTVADSRPGHAVPHRGRSYRVQYSKSLQATDTRFTLAAYRYSTDGFYTFQETSEIPPGTYDDRQINSNKRQRLQLNISQGLGEYGSFFISGYRQSYWNREGYERTLSSGWNGSFGGVNYSLAWSYSTSPRTPHSASQQLAFSLQVPLSRFTPDAWANYSISSSRGSGPLQQAGLSGTALADNSLSYNLQQSVAGRRGGRTGSLSAVYKGTYGELSGGYNYGNGTRQVNYGLKGGIVAHPGGVTLSQTPGQSLVIVRAPGAAGAKIQDYTGVYTDWRGYAVVPYASPYRKNRIALDTGTLGDDVATDTPVQTVIPTQGAVVIADFKTRTGKRVLMTLNYRGHPVPFGAQAKLKQGDSGIVGDDGQVYLTGMPEEGDIAVSWNGAQRCRVRYRLPESKTAQPVVETEQECR